MRHGTIAIAANILYGPDCAVTPLRDISSLMDFKSCASKFRINANVKLNRLKNFSYSS